MNYKLDTRAASESEGLFKKLDRINKFGSKYNVLPHHEVGMLAHEMRKFADTLPKIDVPTDQDQLLQSELKRRLNQEAFALEQRITPVYYDLDTIVSMYGIPSSDVTGLREWLLKNRDETIEAIERLYHIKDIKNYELDLPVDIPHTRRQAEEFASVHIQKYHKRLGKLLQDLTLVGEFLREIDAVPTMEARSYYHPLMSKLAIGVPAICFTTEDGGVQVREKDLITLYGHEGMGHALNHVITKNNGLPYFLTRHTAMTTATMESVAQYYQNIIFEDLKNSPDTQKDLGIEHKFTDIYQEAKDAAQLSGYQLKLFQYAITVIADKALGDPQDSETINRKVTLIEDVTIDPTYPLNVVEQNRYNFDSKGNLNPSLVSELRYCAKPVQRALEEFAKKAYYTTVKAGAG
jgi:hypothetical protein